MLKALFLFISLVFWIAIFTLTFTQRDAGIAAAANVLPNAPQFAYYFSVLALGLGGLWINSMIIDLLSAPRAELSSDELKSSASKHARREMAAGNYRLAVVHFQNAGMFEDALKLAEENKDDELMAKVLFKMGRRRSSRNHYLAFQDYRAAANVSVLLGELDKARKYYGQAADVIKTGDLLEKATLLDRAQRREEAAKLYEEKGEFGKAAECYELEGDVATASRLRDRHETILAYERKKQTETSLTDVTSIRKREANAKELEEAGDMFGAASSWREKEQWARAARCYEKVEEWERAIICHAKCGDENRIRELQLKIKPKTPKQQARRRAADFGMPDAPVLHDRRRRSEAPPPQFGPPTMPPEPGKVASPQFVPLAQQPIQYVPVFVDPGQLSQMIQPQQGAPNNQWADFAAQLEARNLYQQAHELYMKLGRVDEAIRCLAADARPLEAAQMAIGVGDFPKATEFLVEGLEKDGDPELGLLLGEMLIRIGASDLAERLLRRRFARSVNEDNAVFVYKYARLFEDAGDLDRARAFYREMLESGADSPALEERLRAVEAQINDRASGDEIARSASTEKVDLSKANLGAYDAAEKLLEFHPGLFPEEDGEEKTVVGLDEDADTDPGLPPSTEQVPTPASSPLESDSTPRKYRFEPPDHTPYMEGGSLPKGKAKVEETIHHVSLFGSQSRGANNASRVSRATGDTIPKLGSGDIKRGADPFKPLQRYEIVKELGKGGMGVVYEAKDVVLERRLALKVINSFDLGAENLKQFLVEARAIAQLAHPNVITIYDVGLIDMRHYIAMEYIHGGDLRQYVNKRRKLSLKEAITIFVGMCEGLRAVHASGIIHRDIKPANVLLTPDAQPKIVDFGLAKLEKQTDKSMDELSMFRSAGTPGYMPPEQINGEELTPAADIYALGITLFAMIVGRPPHQLAQLRMAMDIFAFTMDGIFPKMSEHREDVPEAIEHLFKYCTAPDISNRYQSIDDFLPIAKQWQASLPDDEEEEPSNMRDSTEKA